MAHLILPYKKALQLFHSFGLQNAGENCAGYTQKSIELLCQMIHVSFCYATRGALTDNLSDWYPPRRDDSASGNGLPLINEIIRDYVLEAQRLSYELDEDLKLSWQEAERREHTLVESGRDTKNIRVTIRLKLRMLRGFSS